jgi:hypothetical protein
MENRGSNEVVVNDLGNLPSIDITQQERLGITRVQDRRLTKIELTVS